MRFRKAQRRTKAFMMRAEGMTFAKIAKEIGVSPKTVSRWENGWKDKNGRKHEGWKERLDEAWQERLDSELHYGLMVRETRLRAHEQIAQMLVARLKEAIPVIRIPNAAAAKAIMSELRELFRIILDERGGAKSSLRTPAGVRADITLEEIQERYAAAMTRDAERVESQEDGEDSPDGDEEPEDVEAEEGAFI